MEYPSEVRPDGASTLRSYLHALWRRKWIALAPLVLLPLVVFVSTLRQSDVYEVSADVLVNRQEVATTSLVGQTPALDDADRTMDTQARLARVPTVVDRALAAANAADVSRDGFLAMTSVFPLGDILRFTVSGDDPERVAALATAYAREFVRYRRELDTVGLADTLTKLRDQIARLEAAGTVDSPLYERLVDRELQLESLEALRRSNVSVVRTAEDSPVEQVAPRPRRNAALAAAAGLVIALVLVFLAENLSTRPRSQQEFEELLGVPLLGRVGIGARGRTALVLGDERAADAAHGLRVNLELASDAIGARTILVTSPRSGDGSASATAQLGAALARAGRRVTLVDLDLRRSALTTLTGVENRCGVTTLSRGDCSLADALVAIPIDNPGAPSASVDSNGRAESRALVEVVGAGPPVAHAAEVLSARPVAALLAELRGRADIVLVDVPAMLETPDAAAVAGDVDGVLLIVGARDARGPMLAEVRRVLEGWPVAPLGFALVESRHERPHPLQFRAGKPSARTSTTEREHVA